MLVLVRDLQRTGEIGYIICYYTYYFIYYIIYTLYRYVCVYMLYNIIYIYEEIYYKKLTHTIMDIDKLQDLQGDLASCRSRQEMI